ncbi:hypothetical protein, partial [Photobacterium damselae]|uniref:hypothetical protein n=1 Tax=Photobacterium damselae TaxID=38293 RepID=UPI001C40AD09
RRTVNPYVAGSSPAGGAKLSHPVCSGWLFFYLSIIYLPIRLLDLCLSIIRTLSQHLPFQIIGCIFLYFQINKTP